MLCVQLQDAWDWMTPHLCDRGEERWPFEQPTSAPLELQRPAQSLAMAYTAVSLHDAYTQRSRLYARVFHHLFFGADPHKELRLGKVRLTCLVARQPMLLRSCRQLLSSLTLCSTRQHLLHGHEGAVISISSPRLA